MTKITKADITKIEKASLMIQQVAETIENRDGSGLTSELRGADEELTEWVANANEYGDGN